MSEDRQAHWNNTYGAKGDRVSWYQAGPGRSFEMIRAAASLDASIIDVGAGASRLADDLIGAGYHDLTLLDISDVALATTRARLADASDKITWIVTDVTEWRPDRTYDVWHDRAVFHFLIEPAAQEAYIDALRAGTRPGSAVILSTFSLTGPEKCSGMPVQRYSAGSLAARIGPDFVPYTASEERHHTPFATTQDFIYVGFRRR